jgi:hypothetical protein
VDIGWAEPISRRLQRRYIVHGQEGAAADVEIGEPTDSDHIDITGELAQKKPAFALDPGIVMLRRHVHILAKKPSLEEVSTEKRKNFCENSCRSPDRRDRTPVKRDS